VPPRPRLGIATVWFASFWAAGVRPSLALLLGAWTVYWSLSERPRLGLEWAAFGAVLTTLFGVLAVERYV
jgi:uncharacterized BrkB/YihY/UPF0761 family membrane protein